MPDFLIERVIKECPHTCTFRFWGRYVRLHADDQDIVHTLTFVYKHFVVPPTERSDTDIECCILRSYAGYQGPALFVGEFFYPLPDTEHFLEHAELIVFRHLFDLLDDYLVLHAGVVARQGRAVVFYGQSGFGKTTLTLELVRRGYGFMSDEFCPVRLSDFMVEPFERLVSIRSSSPLCRSIDSKRASLTRFRGKDFFDCSAADPAHAAQSCPVGACIEICGTVDAIVCPPGGVVLDIYMCTEESSFTEALRRLPGVTLSGPVMKGRYPVFRVTAADRTVFVSQFNGIWKQYNHAIFGVFPYKGEVSTFDCTPVLQQVNMFDAVTSVQANIVNRSPAGRLLSSLGGINAPLTMLLGRLLSNTPCYRLHPGHLDMMSDMIENINN